MPSLDAIREVVADLTEVHKELIIAAGEHNGLLREAPGSDDGRRIDPIPEHDFGARSQRLRTAFIEGMEDLLRWGVFEAHRSAYRLTALGWGVEEVL